MTKKPLLSTFFFLLMFCLPATAVPSQNGAQAHATSQNVSAQKSSSSKQTLPPDDNLPQSASALPLLSVIGAGALLGGLISARRTRSDK